MTIGFIASLSGDKEVGISDHSVLHLKFEAPISELEVEDPLAEVFPGAGSQSYGPRGQSAQALVQRLAGSAAAAGHCHADVATALAAALQDATAHGRVLVFGSFHAAAQAMQWLNASD